MSGWIRSVAFCAFGLAAMLLLSSSAAAQVRVGVAIGAPFVTAPVVVARGPRVIAPVAPYYPPYAYSPYYYAPYAYASPYWGGYYGFNFAYGSYGRRYYAPRGYVYRRGGRYRR